LSQRQQKPIKFQNPVARDRKKAPKERKIMNEKKRIYESERKKTKEACDECVCVCRICEEEGEGGRQEES
jgi:hypothetical protein